MHQAEKLDAETVEAVKKFVAENNTFIPSNGGSTQKRKAEEFNASEKAKRAKTVGGRTFCCLFGFMSFLLIVLIAIRIIIFRLSLFIFQVHGYNLENTFIVQQ